MRIGDSKLCDKKTGMEFHHANILTMPSPAMLRFALPVHAKPDFTRLRHTTPICATLRPTSPCLDYQSSQTSPCQSGGIILHLMADAIMPRCRESARRTWQRRHKVLRLLISFVPNLPDLIWSIWHSLSDRGAPQWTHFLPSLFQTCSRLACHNSLSKRFLGIVFSLSKCFIGIVFSLPYQAQLCHTTPHQAGPHHAGTCPAAFYSENKDLSIPCQTKPYWTATHLANLSPARPDLTGPQLARPDRILFLFFGNIEANDFKAAHADATAISDADQISEMCMVVNRQRGGECWSGLRG